MNIHQFHSGTAIGDAITNQMILFKKLLIDNGYTSNIYAQFIDNKINEKIFHIDDLKCDKEDILLIHHSMGFTCFEQIVKLECKKILIYHNITPVEFIEDSFMKEYALKGIEQVEKYRDIVDYTIADSNYNRRQLLELGYKWVDVLPVQISLSRFDKSNINNLILDSNKENKNILFVGRLFPNKCQEDIITAFSIYNKKFNNKSKLFLVGDNSTVNYIEKINRHILDLDIKNNVEITGKVSEDDLKTYYKISDLFLCMSEHEGFGVPLLEAMKLEVPVMAYDSSAIAETLDGAGILFKNKDFEKIAEKMNEVISNNDIKQKVLLEQTNRIKRLDNTKSEEILINAVNNLIRKDRKPSIQMQGPFETSYSLALVNRKLIENISMLGNYEASIYATEGPGDYIPKEQDLKDKPLAKKLYNKSKNSIYPDITIRNMYPPRVHDVKGGLNFQAFGWEESKLPKEYIEDFNRYLDGIGTMSNFVTNTLKKNGIKIPVKTMGLGVDLPDDFSNIKPYKFNSRKKIKFLHISSCFPRKGVDILLEAYFETFTGDEDVCLVVKTFQNPHNTIEEQINRLKEKYINFPEVELINKDIPTNELYSLYKAASCYIHVARGEGFGLPVAEAMLSKLPVIVSNNSGLADFCDEETAYIVDFEEVLANTHISEGNSMWFEPNKETLKYHMLNFFRGDYDEEVPIKVENAYYNIKENFSWNKIANKWENFIEYIYKTKNKIPVDIISTWNNKCGIAEYTKILCNEMSDLFKFNIYPNYGVNLIRKDEDNVKERLWHSKDNGNLNNLINKLEISNSKIVHIQFNFGFFNLKELEKLITKLYLKKNIIITYHSVKDIDKISLNLIANSLNLVKNVVHQKEDIEYLIKKGVKQENIELVPLGQMEIENKNKDNIRKILNIENSLILGSYGFFLPQKGIKENIIMLKELKKIYPDVLYILSCAIYDIDISKKYFEECKNIVKELDLEENVLFFTDFLDNDESNILLQLCDIILMCYLPTQESASGAIRTCIATKRPIITTNQNIFKEFEHCVYQIQRNETKEKIEAIKNIVKEPNIYVKNIEAFIKANSWEVVKSKYINLYNIDV